MLLAHRKASVLMTLALVLAGKDLKPNLTKLLVKDSAGNSSHNSEKLVRTNSRRDLCLLILIVTIDEFLIFKERPNLQINKFDLMDGMIH